MKKHYSAFSTSFLAHLERNADDRPPPPPFFLATISSQQAYKKGSNTRRASNCVGVWFPKPQKRTQWWRWWMDSQLIWVHGTVKYLAGWFKVDKTTVQSIWNCVFESYYNGDADVFALLCRKIYLCSKRSDLMKKQILYLQHNNASTCCGSNCTPFVELQQMKARIFDWLSNQQAVQISISMIYPF